MSFMNRNDRMMTNTGSVGPLEGVHADWMVSPGLASASLCLTVTLSNPCVSEVSVFMCLISSNPALLNPGPYAFRLYRRISSPAERGALTEASPATSKGFETSILGFTSIGVNSISQMSLPRCMSILAAGAHNTPLKYLTKATYSF